MGRHCGLNYYIMKEGKIVSYKFLPSQYDYDELENFRNIDGRCDSTSIFLDTVYKYEKPDRWFQSDVKPEEKYSARLLLNHPELDGYEKHEDLSEDFDGDAEGWFVKFFYVGFDNFYKLFDFKAAQALHDGLIRNAQNDIKEYKEEIDNIRKHQENVTTKVAFDCFEDKIQNLKTDINYSEEYIKDMQEDDYGYNHYMWIKEFLDEAKKIMEEHPEVIIAAYAND